MARKLRPDETQAFLDAANDETDGPGDAARFLRGLLDKQNEPLELTVFPGVWLRGGPPESAGS